MSTAPEEHDPGMPSQSVDSVVYFTSHIQPNVRIIIKVRMIKFMLSYLNFCHGNFHYDYVLVTSYGL